MCSFAIYSTGEGYCCTTFDLTRRIPASQVESSIRSRQILTLIPSGEGLTFNLRGLLVRIEKVLLESASKSPIVPLRICVPDFATPSWGDVSGQVMRRGDNSLVINLTTFAGCCPFCAFFTPSRQTVLSCSRDSRSALVTLPRVRRVDTEIKLGG
jgi:hypothetical protein